MAKKKHPFTYHGRRTEPKPEPKPEPIQPPASLPVIDLADRSGLITSAKRQDRRALKASVDQSQLLLTAKRVCELCSISRSHLSRMDKKGTFPGRVIIDGLVRYDRRKIEEWIDKQLG